MSDGNTTEDEVIKRVDFKRKFEGTDAKLRDRAKSMLEDLTPKERAILEKRFGMSPEHNR